MAAGFPTKANWSSGDILTAAQMDDLAATVNLYSPAGVTSGYVPTANGTSNSITWAPVSVPTSYGFTAGKNAIINGDFGIWQRGTSFSINSTTVYTADRFLVSSGSAGVCTATQQTFTPGTAPVSGYEGQYYLQVAYGTSGSSAILAEQYVEDVRTLAGQTVTFSFWGKVSSGTFAGATIENVQRFGTGGSGAVVTAQSGTLTFTTSWQRFTATISVPSVSGKTIGAGSSTSMRINIGTSGTNTFQLWGFQMEAGSTATSFQTATGTKQGELAACQRYYFRATAWENQGYAASTSIVDSIYTIPTMRAGASSIDVSGFSAYPVVAGSTYSGGTVTLVATYPNVAKIRYTHGSAVFVLGATIDCNATYVGLSAEL